MKMCFKAQNQLRETITSLIQHVQSSQTNPWNSVIDLIIAINSLKSHIEQSLDEPRFFNISEAGLNYFVEGLDLDCQEYFFIRNLIYPDNCGCYLFCMSATP